MTRLQRGAGMKRTAISRMRRIYGWLVEGRYPNCTTIGRELETWAKSAQRDIDCMRDDWGLPIEYDGKRHGYYFTKKVERLPWVPVSEADLFAVWITQKVLDQYRGMPFYKPLELAFSKITRTLDEEERYTLENLDLAFSIRPFAPEDADLKVLDVVTRAVADRRALAFGYRKPGQKEAESRRVHPYHVMEYGGRLYVMGKDLDRGAVRIFALGRMSEVDATEERFERLKDFDPRKELGASLGVMQGNGDYQVVIEMDAWLTDMLRGRRFHPSQEVTELPGGGSHLRMRLSGLEEIEQYVLSWGTHATVIEPEVLRERVREVAEKVAAKYKT